MVSSTSDNRYFRITQTAENSSTAKKKSYLNKTDRKGKASIPNWDN